MCKTFDIAKRTVQEFIDEHKSFTWDQLQKRILKNGGVLRVAPGVTIGEYIRNNFEDTLYYDEYTKTYGFLDVIEEMYNDLLASY